MTNTAVSPNPLAGLLETTRAHWREHRPRMYAALEKSGKLEDALHAAVEQTKAAVFAMVQKIDPSTGHNYTLFEAWVTFRTEWALLPDEESELVLKYGDPETWVPPAFEDEDEDEGGGEGQGAE